MQNIINLVPGGLLTIAVGLAIFLLVRLLMKPIKLVLKLAINAGIGFILLFVTNMLGSFIGAHIAITWISALIAGFFGVPGVIAMLLYTFFF